MRRLFFSLTAFVFLLAAILTTSIIRSSDASAKKGAAGQRPSYDVRVTPWGPDQSAFDEAVQTASANGEVRRYLNGTRYRMIAVQMLENESKNDEARVPPSRYLVTFYDYTNNRALAAEGRFDKSGPVTVTESHYQMEPSNEEFAEAVQIVERDPNLGASLRDKTLEIYRPMPPVLGHATDDRSIERTVNVGLMPTNGSGAEHEIVGVNMVRRGVIHFPNNAPPSVVVSPDACGVTASGSSSARNLAGSHQVQIMKDGSELWDFMVNRPSSSSGNQGSGIELIDVKYKGKLMLKRAHIPVLNVKYLPGGNCNEFRDWQYNESKFTASGTDVVSNPAPGSGIRVCLPSQGCNTPATTIVETRSDAGNFNGVAIYQEGTQIVLVTEMSAGWYRYLNEYSFDEDGTIRPRYGFGSTTNSCTCSPRVHHAYWRFDFDVNGAANSVYELNLGFRMPFYEFNLGRKGQKLIQNEYTQLRNTQTARTWMIVNPTTNDAVLVSQNPEGKDGTASLENQSVYAQSDVWVLRYKTFPAEVSDTSGNNSGINLAPYFSSPESTVNQDIVLWYGIHLRRDDDTSRPGYSSDRLNGIYTPGPEIRPINW